MCLLICRPEYLNSKRIVHRDVKTENMLLDNRKKMTGETGTLRYMAPEVKEV
jgi:aminoglycoside phosphotransferase (APT) family kinase protein